MIEYHYRITGAYYQCSKFPDFIADKNKYCFYLIFIIASCKNVNILNCARVAYRNLIDLLNVINDYCRVIYKFYCYCP